MFEDNWYLFLLIVMIAFASDGDVSNRETAVMLGILSALTLTNSAERSSNSANGTSNIAGGFQNSANHFSNC